MIIFLEASPEELLAHPVSGIEELFSELIRSSLRGYHLVLIDRGACDWALANLTLNGRERAHLSELKNTFTQKGAMRQQAAFQLCVGTGSFGLQKVGNVYQIGHIPLLRGEYLDKAILLVENEENDGEFVSQVFHALKRDHPVKDFVFETRHGGGSTIVPCFDTALRSKRVIVCLADSDRVAPCGPVSSTVKALHKTAQLQTYVGGLFITLCREVENHLPSELVRVHNLCPQYPDFAKLEALIQNQVVHAPLEKLWFSFDAKNGFVGSSIPGKNYPASVEGWLCEHFGQGDEIDSVLIAGLGDALLQQFLRSGEALRDFAAHIRGEEWKGAFGGFFEEMLWFFAAERRKAIA